MQVSYDRLHIAKKSIATEGDLTFSGGEFVVVANWTDTVKKIFEKSFDRCQRAANYESKRLPKFRTAGCANINFFVFHRLVHYSPDGIRVKGETVSL